MSAESYRERVRSCQCVVCAIMGMTQSTPTEAHHVESVRDELSHYATATRYASAPVETDSIVSMRSIEPDSDVMFGVEQ